MMEALENSELCLIPYAGLVELSLLYKGIAEWLRHFLENNLILHQVKADSWRFESARERYERFLREFPTVAGRASVNDMASYLLMTPESLSRVRSAVSNVAGKNRVIFKNRRRMKRTFEEALEHRRSYYSIGSSSPVSTKSSYVWSVRQ